jgi:regulation of enolase protein 1 (concanavalin A-like superfamily)
VGDVVAACTSTILFNFALAFHRLGYTELSHWIKSGMQYLQEANNLYTVFHQINDDTASSLNLPLPSISVRLAAINNFAHLHKQLNDDDVFERCLEAFEHTYLMWCIGTSSVNHQDQSWQIFMSTLLIIQWSVKQAAPAA